MKARRRRTLLAVVVSFQGETKRRHFFNRRAALQWLAIEAPAIFPGRVERMELYNSRGTLIWKKINNVFGNMTARRTFIISLRSQPGVDAVRALRQARKILLRRFGLEAIEIKEERHGR
jgi:hypothetical protein